MGLFLGIDTSNYTTSMALLDSESGKMIQQKKLLPVEKGALGLRQSEALFQHVRQLPELALLLFGGRAAPLHWRELGYPPDPDGGRILICPVFWRGNLKPGQWERLCRSRYTLFPIRKAILPQLFLALGILTG